MRWPWQRHREQIADARREHAEVRRRGEERKPMLNRIERDGERNQFGERWQRALGGGTS